MSITFTYKDIGHPSFISGFRKLLQSDKWSDPKKAYNISRMSTLLDQELKTYHHLRLQFANKCRSVKPENNENSTEADKAKLEEMKAEAEKFSEVSFVIERHKVDFADLEGIALTPSEILALTPILDNLPD